MQQTPTHRARGTGTPLPCAAGSTRRRAHSSSNCMRRVNLGEVHQPSLGTEDGDKLLSPPHPQTTAMTMHDAVERPLGQLPACRFLPWIASWNGRKLLRGKSHCFHFTDLKQRTQRCSIARPQIHGGTQNSGEVQDFSMLEDTDAGWNTGAPGQGPRPEGVS